MNKSFELWSAKKIRIKKIVIAHTPAIEKVFVAIVSLITEKWDSYRPVISRTMWKELTTGQYLSFWKPFRSVDIIGTNVWIKLDVAGQKSL